LATAKDELVVGLYRALSFAIKRVPLSVSYLGAEWGARLMRWSLRDREANYLANLCHILGGLSERDSRIWAKKAFSSYARYWVDGALAGRYSRKEVLERFRAENAERVLQALSAGRGVVLALAHLGSFEIGARWLYEHGYPMWTVAERVKPEKLFQFFVKERERAGLRVLPLSPSAAHTLSRVLKEGGLVGLLCDRDIAGNGVEVTFFGVRVRLPAGPALLAVRTGAMLVPVGLYTLPAGYYRAIVGEEVACDRGAPLRAEVERVTQVLAKELERLISIAPDQWHMFQPLLGPPVPTSPESG
jgi:lauroyl/myristoyl acyltransferase